MATRRELLASLSTLWLARAAAAVDAVDPFLAHVKRIDELSRALKAHRIPQTEWQREVEQAARAIDLGELLARTDFEKVIARLPLLPKGTSAEKIDLLAHQNFTPKIFAMGKGRAIIPHGHDNMVSHHLVLRGELHGWHWQRLRTEEKHLVLQPTIDRVFKPGDSSSISDDRDNVHWFVALSERAYTLDCIVDNLDPDRGYRYHIDFVDPRASAAQKDGTVRMPRLELDDALERYG